MSIYYPGLNEARAQVAKMDLEGLLCQIDALYGREYLSFGDTLEDVRQEAMLQTELDFIADKKECLKQAWFQKKFGKYFKGE